MGLTPFNYNPEEELERFEENIGKGVIVPSSYYSQRNPKFSYLGLLLWCSERC